MSAPAKKFATYEDVLAAPQNMVAELVAGELHTQPRPAYRHALAGSALGAALFSRYHGSVGNQDGPGGWVILLEPELHLSADVLVPDIAGWRRERMPELPDVPYSELPPDFCCEILSPSTARLDRQKKLPIYGSHGVGHVWLIDPATRLLEVLVLDGASYRLFRTYAEDEVVEPPPFDAVPLLLERLWKR